MHRGHGEEGEEGGGKTSEDDDNNDNDNDKERWLLTWLFYPEV